jgi:hypothetical protein
MADFLSTYAQHQDVQELNKERTMSFFSARRHLGSILDQTLRDTTFHIFWSPRDAHGGWCQDVVQGVADIKDIVDTLAQRGQVPYICLDILALEEWDRQNAVEECDGLIDSLQAFGGIVERSETFWTERMQHSVFWDALQGTVVDRAMNSRASGTGTNSDEIDTSHELTKNYFNPRDMALPPELILLCNLYDRHVLRQQVIIQLSLPLNRRMELCKSGENAPDKDVDHLYLWCFARARDADEEFGGRRELELAVEVDENNVIINSRGNRDGRWCSGR